jgi:hypothetical protein
VADQTDALTFAKAEAEVVNRFDDRMATGVLTDPATRREIEHRLFQRAMGVLVDRKFDGDVTSNNR